MNLIRRKMNGQEDFARIRSFLEEIFLQPAPRQYSWNIARFDYWYGFAATVCESISAADYIYLWETGDGQLAAVLHPEGLGEAFLEIRPDMFNCKDLVEDMIATAEDHLPVAGENVPPKLYLWANEHDELRQTLLQQCGYSRWNHPEYMRWRSMDDPISAAPTPEGFTIRVLRSEEELPSRSWASFRAFHPNDPEEKYTGWDWYASILSLPLYRSDMDLVAAAPDGRIAAFCTIWVDPVNRTGMFEPVGTDPDFQRIGLGKAVMTEGLRRLKDLGCTRAYVGSYSVPASALYASVGFTGYDLCYPWIKTF